MPVASYPVQSSKAAEVIHEMRFVGTGAAVPTRELGQGVTLTRSGVGVLLLTWAENPGVFVNAQPELRAATPGNVKNCDVVLGVYNPATRAIAIEIYSSAGAARDLAALEYLDLSIKFAHTTA